MQGIILVPGIMGSKLSLDGTEIWPPNLEDLPNGYRDIQKLLDPEVIATDVIYWAVLPCAVAYAPLDTTLRQIRDELNGQYLPFFYDWRKDLRIAANMLAQAIEDFCADTPGITEITLVCHSMGGLVGRLLLEGIYGATKPSWFSKIKRLICICTPHLGAPQALSECMGVEGSELISPANIKLLSGDHRYPAGYELLPAEGNSTLRDITNGMEQSLDFYQSSVAQLIGLDLTNLGAAQQLRAALNLTARPKGVDYQFIFGTGQKTDQGVDIVRGAGGKLKSAEPKTDNLGDGTVPIWSAGYFGGDATIGRWSTAGDHVGILATLPLTLKIRAYFGLAEALLAAATQPPTVVLSLNKHVYAPDESMHVLVIPHDEPTQLDGTLITHRVTSAPPADVALTAYSNIEVSYRGGATKLLQFTVPAPADTGAYRLSFAPGSHASQAESPGWFAVSNYASH